MYHKVAIKPLSVTQRRNMIKGRGVRVRHDPSSPQHVYMSNQQMKQLDSAHRKGRGITLVMDPHQANCHKKDGCYGSGIFGPKFDKFVAKTIGQKAKDKLYTGLNMIAKPLVKGAIGKVAKAAELYGIPGPAVGAMRQVAQNYIEDPGKFQTKEGFKKNIVASALEGVTSGAGTRQRKPPRKPPRRKRGGALFPAGGALFPAGGY